MAIASDIIDPRLPRVQAALESVCDPEIPVVNVIEMGMIDDVHFEDGQLVVHLLPTFAGCPAINIIRENILTALDTAGFSNSTVNAVFDPPWTTDRVTPEGRRKLKEFGLAPPSGACGSQSLGASLHMVQCPHCSSSNTTLESIFGPTLCRAIHYCNACHQSFEQFKQVSAD